MRIRNHDPSCGQAFQGDVVIMPIRRECRGSATSTTWRSIWHINPWVVLTENDGLGSQVDRCAN